MSVVGFDFGNLFCYTACARGGGIETLANEYSARNTPTYVSFSGKQRLMGTASQQAAVTNLKNTFYNLKRFLGRSFDDPRVIFERQNFVGATDSVKTPNGGVIFRAEYNGETKEFTPEQLTAMMLTKLKSAAEVALDVKSVTDCVISVPSYFTTRQRRKLLEASEMANLNCIKLMNETTAVALSYGIYKQDLPAPEEKPRHVIFVDFGHSSLQTSAVALQKGKLKMLATVSDPDIGGRNFDLRLAEHFNEAFKERYKIDASSKPRAFLRLVAECEKLKKLMSANSTDLPLNIECLLNDIDVSGRMKREEFESLSADLLQRIETTFQELLSRCGLMPDQIHSVEVVGGSSRIPAVKKLIQKVFGHEASTTLNADEAVARGCALQCAILSPTFRVRDFDIVDCQNFPIDLEYSDVDGNEQSMEVFQEWSQVPMSKVLTFYRKEPFGLRAVYGKSTPPVPYPDLEIGQFLVEDVKPSEQDEPVKVKVKVRVDTNGVFKVSQAQMVKKKDDPQYVANMDVETSEGGSQKLRETAETTTEANDPTVAESTEEKTDQNTTQDDCATEPSSSGPAAKPSVNEAEVDVPSNTVESKEAPMDTTPDEAGDVQSQVPQETKEGEKKDEVSKTEPVKEKKQKMQTTQLRVESRVWALTKEELNQFHEIENQMIAQDKQERERQNAKNALEEYIYEMRYKCGEEFQRFIEEGEKEKFLARLNDMDEWLYDGEDEIKSVYVDNLKELKSIGQPIVDRYREFQLRPKAFEDINAVIQRVFVFLDLHAKADDKYVHISTEDAAKAFKAATDAAEWMRVKSEAQAKLSLHAPPVVLVSAIVEELKKLEEICVPIMTKPKPKSESPPAKELKTEKEDVKESVKKTKQHTNGEINGDNSSVNGDENLIDKENELYLPEESGRGVEMDLD